jgi:SAM-dependent methyltransferase
VSDDAELVRAIRDRSAANDSIAYAHRVYAEISALAARHGLVSPGSVLEIGPGVNLGALFCFAASGVPRAVGVDVAQLPEPPRGFYENLRSYILAIEGFVWWRAWVDDFAGVASFPSVELFPAPGELLSRVEHRAGVSSEALPFADAEFDLVYSVAALEHVPEPGGTVRELWRVLKPGGLAIHEIDLKHHGSDDPLKFLEWNDAEWRARARPYGADLALDSILDRSYTGEVYCNRLRQRDWTDLFLRVGFDVEAAESVIRLDPDRVRPERFAAPFRARPIEDLQSLTVRIVARKPADADATISR